MKIRLLKGVLVGGKPMPAGAVVDVSPADAASLCRRGMAETEDGHTPEDPSKFLDASAPEPEQPKRRRK